MQTSIVIEGLKIFARHGVFDQERRVGNVFELDIHLNFDATSAMHSDEVEDTVNYARITDMATQAMAEPSNLLEHAAYRIKTLICEAYPEIVSGQISLYKIHPPLNVQLTRVGFILKW